MIRLAVYCARCHMRASFQQDREREWVSYCCGARRAVRARPQAHASAPAESAGYCSRCRRRAGFAHNEDFEWVSDCCGASPIDFSAQAEQ